MSLGAGVAKIAAKVDDFLHRNRDRADLCNSFPTGTPVLMADGTHQAIDDIETGDQVLAYNTANGTWSPREVTNQWSHVDQGDIVKIRLTDGSTVSATDHHKFWTQHNGWVYAENLQPGDLLVAPTNNPTVADITYWPEGPNTVWELTVDTHHTFAVSTGSSDVVVHNQGGDCPLDLGLPSELQVSADALDHIFRGSRGGGFHHRPDGFDPVTGGSSTFTGSIFKTPVNGEAFYQAWVKVKKADGSYQVKPSTFFPDSWDRQRITKSIEEAYTKAIANPDGKITGSYSIRSEDLAGNPIQIFLDADGNLTSAFPDIPLDNSNLGLKPTV